MKSGCKRILFWLSIAAVGLILMFVLGCFIRRARVAHRVSSQLSAIRTAGLPTNDEELDRWYAAVPDAENAALVITQALGQRQWYDYTNSHYQELNDFKVPPAGQRLDVKQRRLLSDFVSMNAGALVKAHEAAKLTKARYPIDLKRGPETLLPHLQVKGLARLEEYQALLALGTSRSNQAAVAVKSILDMARTLEAEPILISQVVRIRMLGEAKETLERSLAQADFSEPDLAGLQEAFSTSERADLMARALIGQRAMDLSLFNTNIVEIERLRKAFGDFGNRPKVQPLEGREVRRYRMLQWFDLDHAFYLDVMETNIAIAKLPPSQRLLQVTNLSTAAESAAKQHYVLSALFLPDFHRISQGEFSSLATLRLSKVALALERFRLNHGQVPERLAELVPQFLDEVPSDPFDGLPLRYSRLGKGYTVQSVGQEQVVEGSEPFYLKLNLVFTVKR